MTRNSMIQDDDPCWDDPTESSLGNAFAEQLQSTPWWALSLSLHLLLVVGVLPLIHCNRPTKPKSIQLRTRLVIPDEESLEEPVKPDDIENPTPQQPQLVEAEVETPHPPNPVLETHNEQPTQETNGAEGQAPNNNMGQLSNDRIGMQGGAGKLWGKRGQGGNINGGPPGGPTRKTQGAVHMGLKWLKRHQHPSGHWDADGFPANCQDGVCTGPGQSWTDPGVTGLATLAFLGAGHTHRFGRYKDTVKRAVQWMIKAQRADGLVGQPRSHYMYNQAICALALVEAYGMTSSPLIRDAATRSVTFLIRAQNPGAAWRYRQRSGDNDISVTGWVVMALKSARAAELPIPGLTRSFRAVQRYIESLTDDAYYVTGYRRRPPTGWQGPTGSRLVTDRINTAISHSATHSPTAIATMTRIFLGYPGQDARLHGGAKLVAGLLPCWQSEAEGQQSTIDFYYWYYGTLAMFQMGGEYWKQWNPRMKTALVDHQITRKGCARGSWPVVDPWCSKGGRVYATAINVLTLEIYYRYPRVFK